MGSKTYDPQEIEEATGDTLSSPRPESAFFMGPTSESDRVYTFAHKLDALFFLRDYYGEQLGKAESDTIDEQISRIHGELTDANTPPLSELMGDSDAIEIYADGYWDDFVISSQPFWEDWVEEAGDLIREPQFMEIDDEEENPDQIEEEDEMAKTSAFLFGEPPEDVFNDEFMDAMVRIIPLAG